MLPAQINFITISLTVIELFAAVQSNIVVMPEVLYTYTSPTAKVDNYILQHQRQFEQQIQLLEKYLEDFRKQFELRLEVIAYYDDIVDIKLRDFKSKLDPLEMLGDVNDVCVEKYRIKMPSDSNLKNSLKTCVNKAKTVSASLTSNPENTLKNIRNHFVNHFNNSIKECKKKYEKDEMKYKTCAATAIKNTINYFDTNANTFYTQMAAAECSSNTKIDEAFDCYSLNVYQIFTVMGEVNGLIENCLTGHDFYSACDFEGNGNVVGRCPYQMSWHLSDDDMKKDQLVNPFKGINSTTPCLQINFIKKDFQY